MIILTNLSKLEKATEEEIDFLKAHATDRVIIMANKESVPVSVLTLTLGSGMKAEMIPSADDEFSLGFSLGQVVASAKEEVVILLDREIKVAAPNITIGIPEKKVRKPRTSKKKEENVVEEKSAHSSESVKTKAEKKKPVLRETPVAVSIKEDEDFLPFPEVEESSDLRESIKASSNKELARIAENETLYKRLLKAVKDSSDKRIGLEQLLNVHFGKDISKMIIADVATFYDRIKADE